MDQVSRGVHGPVFSGHVTYMDLHLSMVLRSLLKCINLRGTGRLKYFNIKGKDLFSHFLSISTRIQYHLLIKIEFVTEECLAIDIGYRSNCQKHTNCKLLLHCLIIVTFEVPFDTKVNLPLFCQK